MATVTFVSREGTADGRETDETSPFFVRHESPFYFPCNPAPVREERTGSQRDRVVGFYWIFQGKSLGVWVIKSDYSLLKWENSTVTIIEKPFCWQER